jgi:hypothetical protein
MGHEGDVDPVAGTGAAAVVRRLDPELGEPGKSITQRICKVASSAS